jgi:hypothetical protein
MNVEIGTVAAQILFWDYLSPIFGIGSLQCGTNLLSSPCVTGKCVLLSCLKMFVDSCR